MCPEIGVITVRDGESESMSWLRRFASLVGALVLLIGATVHSHAQQSGNVTVTGQIVAAPMSISIAQSTIGFGDIDSKGTMQTGTKVASGFAVATGAYWYTDSKISITVSSPTQWTGRFCRSNDLNVPGGGFALIDTSDFPTNSTEAQTRFNAAPQASTNCSSATSWISGAPATTQRVIEKHLATQVLNGDQTGSFSSTLTFSVSTT
jgi:type 1 fimbria pilin